MGYETAVVIANRVKADMWKALGQAAGSQKWIELASGTGKSGNIKIETTTTGSPKNC